MTAPPTTLNVIYTAPGNPDLNEDRATLSFGSNVNQLEVACGTFLYLQHPAEHTLRLESPAWATTSNSQHLSFLLPDRETETTFVLIAETTGTAATIRVNTKKEPTKPDPVRRVAFGV
ncbi:hypothetical protein SAMN02745121_03557 [Nannocystis exedens]|uniref:Uncharacterized protein n=1 Tax=Nannocystis exedens TaxID=54 RepID=A0A1I1YV05_9BACT|nr:hypothetical protein [Nannocystis exedens]PCC70122.1 hypothetical protein NAEX_03155 [Nannocystis exedens]SFE23281.1 hypothetical protein SAMN02745121_03557 [Nannocystis exedens]